MHHHMLHQRCYKPFHMHRRCKRSVLALRFRCTPHHFWCGTKDGTGGGVKGMPQRFKGAKPVEWNGGVAVVRRTKAKRMEFKRSLVFTCSFLAVKYNIKDIYTHGPFQTFRSLTCTPTVLLHRSEACGVERSLPLRYTSGLIRFASGAEYRFTCPSPILCTLFHTVSLLRYTSSCVSETWLCTVLHTASTLRSSSPHHFIPPVYCIPGWYQVQRKCLQSCVWGDGTSAPVRK